MRKIFFVFGIIALELGVGNSYNLEQDTWHRQSMCQKRTLRFILTLGKTFSKSTSLRMMQKHDKTALTEISQVSGTLSHDECQSVF